LKYLIPVSIKGTYSGTEWGKPEKAGTSPSTRTGRPETVVNGKPVFNEPDKLKAARAKLQAHLGQYVPEQKFTGPVRLMTWWCFPVTGKHKNGEYRTSKPDTDNLVKLLKDVMTELHFWKDDARWRLR
jgi:Holliday junction resolvase RusA-like endonuclease